MNLHRYPHLVDQLAAEHALGLVRGGARRRLEMYAEHDVVLRRALDDWRRRIEPLSEFAPARTPPAAVWTAIERRLGLAPASAAAREAAPRPIVPQVQRWFERVSFWRGWAIGVTALAAIAVVIAVRSLLPFGPAAPGAPSVAEQPAPGVSHVAVLNNKDAKAVMLAAWDESHSTVTLRRLADIAPPEGRAMQLWGVPASGHPVSLGVLPAAGDIKLPAGSQRPESYTALAISIEPMGGSPNPDGPSGPVVYVGKLVPVS
jgi:anti-sigma-K factor RskA